LFTNRSFPRFPDGLRNSVAVALLVAALQGAAALAEDASGAPILTIIVTRHGVRSYSPLVGANDTCDKAEAVDNDEAADNNSPSAKYKWADWNPGDPTCPIKANDLTRHGYVLMTIMGNYYRNRLKADRKRQQFDCGQLFVYADVDQRTLGTAHALVEGLCTSPSAVKIFHEVDPNNKDPLFNATEWTSKNGGIVPELSNCAIRWSATAAPIKVPCSYPDASLPTKVFNSQLSQFKELLDKRCIQGCDHLGRDPFFQDADNKHLASLKGQVDTARTYSENVFLEYAQCGDITAPDSLVPSKASPVDLDELQKGLEVHVGGYAINGRDDFMNKDRTAVYNPFIRGETLLWHIVALMDQRAGRTGLGPITKGAIPGELDVKSGKSVVIFSGHDTQLAALGGMLDAHWLPPAASNIVRDDMPPGSALVFDLLNQNGAYRVQVRFATMARDRFRKEAPLGDDWLHDGVGLYPVTIGACGGATCDLSQLEAVASDNARRGGKDIVAYGWTVNDAGAPKDPKNVDGVFDPKWTKCP